MVSYIILLLLVIDWEQAPVTFPASLPVSWPSARTEMSHNAIVMVITVKHWDESHMKHGK